MVALVLLLASTLHAGPELPVSAPIRNAQPHVQRVEDVAGDDGRALVVWREDALVRGVRVDRTGMTLDAAPLLIAYASWEYARVARGATNWLVATAGSDRVEARLVSDDGAVGPVIPIAASAGVPDVAFDGNGYLVAWWDVNASRVLATRISAEGEVLGSAIPLADSTIFRAVFPAAGGGFVVVVQKENVEAIRHDAQAHEVSRTVLMPTIEWRDPVFGLDAAGHVVIGWHDAFDVAYIKREGAEPRAIDARKILGFTTIGGTAYAIAQRDEDLVLAKLTGETAREISGPVESAGAVPFGDRVLLVTSYTDVFRTMLDASLQTIAPAAFLYGEPDLQFLPAVARAGDATLIAWSEGDGLGRVRARLNDGAPFDLGEGTNVQLATDGHDFLVTWTSIVPQHFRIVSHDGTLGKEGSIGVWSAGSCITWNGDEYIIGVVNQYPVPRARRTSALMQRVTRDGNATDLIEVSGGTESPSSIACASTASMTLFAYDDAQGNLGGATLTRGGTLSHFPIGRGRQPSVAAQADGFLAAWLEVPYATQRVFWTPISEGGTVGLERAMDANAIRVASRPGGYLLMVGTDPLRVRTIDRNGDFTGPEVPIASDAATPAFAGDTLVYMRDADILPRPRWRVFLRELDLGGRRRVMRR